MREKEFATLPVGRVFLKLALPNVLSTVFTSFYIIADGIFVGRYIGESALAAVNLVMPILFILFALSDMIAIGASVKTAACLGAGENLRARQLFSASVAVLFGMGFAFCVFGLVTLRPMIFTLIRDGTLAGQAYRYSICFAIGFPLIVPTFALDNFLRVCGMARYSMWVNIGVSLLNIFLDWLFLARMGLGIEASALASVLSLWLDCILLLIPLLSRRLSLYLVRPRITKADITGILYNGSSEFLGNTASNLMAIVVNAVLLHLGGSLGVAGYSIVMYLDSLLKSILYGVTDSIQPAVSYNLGAGRIDRTFRFFRLTCLVTMTASLLCLGGVVLFPRQLAAFFSRDPGGAVIETTVAALLLFCPSYLFCWFNMVTSAFLTAIDRPRESVHITFFRSVGFPLVCLLVLAPLAGVYGVFFTTTASELLTCLFALFVWRRVSRMLRQPQAEKNA